MKICYFGIYDQNFSRNAIYMKGLRENGSEVIECNDCSPGLTKFWRLYKKHKEIKGDYDVMIVGYPSQITVLFAKLISSKKVVLDALCSLYEGEIISRRTDLRGSLKAFKIWLIDFVAYQSADLVLVETNAQAEFFEKTFFVRKGKCVRIFTGASDDLFFPDLSIQKRPIFTAVFRGQFLPEAGVETILETAAVLLSENIHFLLIGKDFPGTNITEKVHTLQLPHVEVVSSFLPFDELRCLMLSCHMSLGQFGVHERLERTIPHKAFETLALGLPYITARARGIEELLIDGENCLMTIPGNAQDLAEKILQLKNDLDLTKKITGNALSLYKSRLTPFILTNQILSEIKKL